MNPERAAWITAVVVLLIVGLFIGRQFLGRPDGAPAAQRSDRIQGTSREGSFRPWFWESRGLDLVAQVGLIFVGALGIAALLPQGRGAVQNRPSYREGEEDI